MIISERASSHNEKLKWLATNSNKLDGVSPEKGKLSLSLLEKDVPGEAKKFSESLYQMLSYKINRFTHGCCSYNQNSCNLLMLRIIESQIKKKRLLLWLPF